MNVLLTGGKSVKLQPGNFTHLKRQLLSGVGADLEILCQNGARIKCHREILVDWSEVLRNKLEEVEPDCPLKMEDLSEEDVKVFVEYLYIKSESKSIWTLSFIKGMDLMEIAVKYEVWEMMRLLESIIMSKKDTDKKYFFIDGAIRLYAIGTKTEIHGFGRLKKKAACVLRNYLETDTLAVRKSEGYQNLFKRDPEAAMDLINLVFTAQ